MNQKVQLFIENQEVDIFQDSSINIVSSIKDYRQPDKLFTDYSQNFNLPATTRNNKIFKHYYDYDIGDGGFDARKSKEARIEINDRPFKEGYIVLESVDLKYNKPSTYKVTFFGGLRLLKELFQDLKLSDLTWLDNFNITNQGYDASKTDTFYNYLTTSKDVTIDSTTYTQPVVVPLISNKDRLYYNSNTAYYGVLEDGNLYYDSNDYPSNNKKNGVNWQNLKPGIRIDNIIRAIEKLINANTETPSIEFSNDFFNSSNLDYYNLYMWLNKDVDEEKDIVTQRKIIDVFNNGVSRIYRTYASGTVQEQVMSIVSTDDEGNTTGQTSDRFILSGVQDESIDSVECRVSLISSNTTDKFDLQLMKDGVVVSTINQEVQTGGNSYLSFYLEQDGKYQFRLQTKSDVNINFDSGFKVQFVIRARSDRDSFNDVTIFGGALNILANVVDFSMSENMPDMTILEFLSGIFKMFNLVCYVQSDINATYANYSANITNVKTIRVMTFDAYYASSNAELDITDKIDISSASVHRQVPYTKIEF